MDTLNEIYDQRKSGISMFAHGSKSDQELQAIEECFQKHFQAELLKVGIVIDKLSTYLSEDSNKLSICTEYHPEGLSNTLLFEIKINQTEVNLEYIFIHDEKVSSSQIKNRLESISK